MTNSTKQDNFASASTPSSLELSITMDDYPARWRPYTVRGCEVTLNDWLDSWGEINDGRVMASMGDFYLYFKSLKDKFDNGNREELLAAHAAMIRFKSDFCKDSYYPKCKVLLTGTRVFYNPNDETAKIVHHYQCNRPELIKEIDSIIPVYNIIPIDEVSKTESGLKCLQALLDTSDGPEIIIPTLKLINDIDIDKVLREDDVIKVDTPNTGKEREDSKLLGYSSESTVGMEYLDGSLSITCVSNDLKEGFTRGVRIVSPSMCRDGFKTGGKIK